MILRIEFTHKKNEDWWNSLGHVIINNSHTSLEQEIDKYINEQI
jgi:hypothetical protein